MTEENANPDSADAMTVKSGEGQSVRDRVPSDQAECVVSSESEAVVEEVSVRRRTALKILADR